MAGRQAGYLRGPGNRRRSPHAFTREYLRITFNDIAGEDEAIAELRNWERTNQTKVSE